MLGYLFLNQFLSLLDNKSYCTFLLAILAISQLTFSGNILESLASGLRDQVAGIFLYSLGGYIQRFNPFNKLRTWVLYLIIAFTYLCIYISSYNHVVGQINKYLADDAKDTFHQSFIAWTDYNMVVFIIAIALFEIFRRIKMANYRVINFLGASTFMIYLLHDNNVNYSIWLKQNWSATLAQNPLKFVAIIGIWSVGIFFFGVVVQALYLGIIRLFNKSKRFMLQG